MGEEVLYVQFNQDYSSLAVGTGGEWTLVSLTSLEALDRIHEASAPDGVQIVERLFSSSLVAIVSLKSPRKLRVCHFKKGNEICNYSYQNTILGVRLNRAVSIWSDLLFNTSNGVNILLKIIITVGWGNKDVFENLCF